LPLAVRPATAADVPLLVELVDGLNASEGNQRGRFTAAIALRDGFGEQPEFGAVVAELDGHAVGYALFQPSYSTEWGLRGLYMHDLYVVPEARRQGVGRALVAAVAARARAEQRRFVWWVSRSQNRGAQKLYAGLANFSEPTLAHAIAFEAFDRLVGEHEVRHGAAGVQP
jgi:ribosomal protein S18 acetylase RimI-like enzyme